MINAHDAMNTAMGGAKTAASAVTDAASAVSGVAKTAATGTKGLGMDAFVGAMHLLKLARGLEVDDVLGLVGLMRRKSPLGSLFLLGGGIAIGAGLGMLLAPVSGREARAFLIRALGGLGDNVTDKVDTLKDNATEAVEQVQQRAGQVVEQVQEKAGEIAGQVADKAGQVMGQDEGGEEKQADAEGEGEGRRGRRARSNHNTHLS